jgi:hypothetical protein
MLVTDYIHLHSRLNLQQRHQRRENEIKQNKASLPIRPDTDNHRLHAAA